MRYKSFLDAREIPSRTIRNVDLCIIGGGAAGITIAREFANTDLKVCLLEAGGMNLDKNVDALSLIEDAGRDFGDANTSRLRMFGGTTNHWGGHCAPLQPDDFEKHDWIDYSGWPYGYDTLHPFYRRAHDVLGLGEYSYDTKQLAMETGQSLFPFNPERVPTVVSRYNRVRFGLSYGDLLDGSPNIETILYADVSSINLEDAASQTVTDVEVKSIAGNAFNVRAKYFVVAAGGIENPRLLLLSNRQRSAGLGNHSDLVGRFFQVHLWYDSGYIAPTNGNVALDLYCAERAYNSIAVRAHLALPSEVIRELRIPKFRAEIRPTNPALISAIRIYRGNASVNDVLTLATNPPSVGNILKCRNAMAQTVYGLGNYVQQTPHPESRIMLSDLRDPIGRQQPQLKWRITQSDHDGMKIAHNFIAREVARSGFGRMRIELKDADEIPLEGGKGGNHHMGATRMNDNPQLGVADGNAKVHYTNNLYIAGSSLFPTCGWANPTLTIVATSLRLATHLKTKFNIIAGL